MSSADSLCKQFGITSVPYFFFYMNFVKTVSRGQQKHENVNLFMKDFLVVYVFDFTRLELWIKSQAFCYIKT